MPMQLLSRPTFPEIWGIWPPEMVCSCNILKKKSPTANKRWSSSSGVGRGANYYTTKKHLVKNVTRGGSCEHGNGPLASVKGGEFLD